MVDERTEKNQEFFSEGGIKSFVEYLNRSKTKLNEEPIYFYAEAKGIYLEVAMQWNDGYKENILTFANNINTIEGGTHLAAPGFSCRKILNLSLVKFSTNPLTSEFPSLVLVCPSN